MVVGQPPEVTNGMPCVALAVTTTAAIGKTDQISSRFKSAPVAAGLCCGKTVGGEGANGVGESSFSRGSGHCSDTREARGPQTLPLYGSSPSSLPVTNPSRLQVPPFPQPAPFPLVTQVSTPCNWATRCKVSEVRYLSFTGQPPHCVTEAVHSCTMLSWAPFDHLLFRVYTVDGHCCEFPHTLYKPGNYPKYSASGSYMRACCFTSRGRNITESLP
jgi:hypothetical protein